MKTACLSLAGDWVSLSLCQQKAVDGEGTGRKRSQEGRQHG